MSDRPAAGRRIGLAFPGPLDASSWSGTLAGLAHGLRAHGAEPVHLRSAPPPLVERVLRRLPGWRLPTALDQAALAIAHARAGELDGVVLVGTSAELRGSTPYVTYQDMTLRQAIALDDPFVTARPRAEVEAWRRREQRIYAGAAALCTMGGWAAESLRDDYGLAPSRVHVVGAGVNHVVEPVERDWSRPRFLFIGRDYERKNGPAVLRAFAALHAERHDATLDVVGEHPPIDQPGVTGHGPLALHEPGSAPRVARLLQRATCMVMPSRYEPFGIVYAEAAHAGVPSIATTVGAGFVDGDVGRRVPPDDPAALLAAMRELCDGELARALGARARERAELFTWPLVAGRVLRALDEARGRPLDGLPDYL